MSTRVDSKLVKNIKKYGAKDWNACFHCGNCTAVCGLTEQGVLFPRKNIRTLQMGLSGKLATSTEPWLCYYCGDCSETCPRDANPGELMMAVRRWLTTKYDWTGLAKLFYTSLPALIIALILVAASFVYIAFTKNFDLAAMMEFGHHFEQYAIYSVFAIIIVPNLLHMFWLTIIKAKVKAPLGSYITGIFGLFIHMFTQKKTLKCDNITFRWFEHFLVVIGYIVLLFTTVFLNWFGTDNTMIIYLGYIVGGMVFIFTFDFILARIRAKKEVTKFSHPTDWLFVIWLFLMGFTAFIVRLLIDLDMMSNGLWIYMIHIIVLAQWAVIIVPFGKWTHFLYRSFAIYFANIIKAGLKKQGKL